MSSYNSYLETKLKRLYGRLGEDDDLLDRIITSLSTETHPMRSKEYEREQKKVEERIKETEQEVQEVKQKLAASQEQEEDVNIVRELKKIDDRTWGGDKQG